MNERSEKPKAICPSISFKVGYITREAKMTLDPSPASTVPIPEQV